MTEVAHLNLVCVQCVQSAVQHLDLGLHVSKVWSAVLPAHLRHRTGEVGSEWLGIHEALRTAVDTRMPSLCTPH